MQSHPIADTTDSQSSKACPPVSRIPPELLLRILQIHVNDTARGFDKSYPGITCNREANPYSWIRISHVCQHWRAVSLSCPLLWSSIIITQQIECMQAMLDRSQQIPLDVRTAGRTGCYLSKPFPLKSLRLVLAQLHRIHSLELAINWWMYDDIAELLQHPAPLLRTFRLSTPNGGYDGGWLCPVMSVSGEEELSQLEEISLNCYVFPWVDPAPFRLLKSLHIDNRGLVKPAIEEVAFALGKMTRLVSLTLHGVLYGGHAQTLARAKPDVIQLPMLERLMLSGDSLACSTLLKLLSFPASARLELNYESDKHSDALALSMSSVGHKLAPSRDASSRLSLLHVGKSCEVHLHSLSADTSVECDLPETGHHKLSLKIAALVDHVETVCQHLRPRDAGILHITPLPSEISTWLTMFGHFGDQKEVHLAQWQPLDVTALLLQRLNGEAAGLNETADTQGAILRGLRVLQLSEVNFAGVARGLRDALDVRSGRDSMLDRLVLRDCSGLSATDIASLTEAVLTLDWDRKGLDHIPCITITTD